MSQKKVLLKKQDCKQLTLFQEDSRASRLALLGSKEARKMTVTSGRKCSELLRKSDPLGCLAKMLLVSSEWHSTRCFLTWKIKATPRYRLLFQLAVSMPRIEEKGCLFWHTPNVPNGGRVNPPEMTPTGKMPDGRKRQVGLEHQVKMVEQMMWPTPNTKDGTKPRSIESLQKMIDDPKNRKKKPSNLREIILWPTPNATDVRDRGQRNIKGRQTNLSMAVRNCPSQKPGSLNPMWVEWLMGFPLGWTDLNASGMQ